MLEICNSKSSRSHAYKCITMSLHTHDGDVFCIYGVRQILRIRYIIVLLLHALTKQGEVLGDGAMSNAARLDGSPTSASRNEAVSVKIASR